MFGFRFLEWPLDALMRFKTYADNTHALSYSNIPAQRNTLN